MFMICAANLVDGDWEWTTSNTLNLVMVFVTAGIGFLAWYRSGQNAKEAKKDAGTANEQATKSAEAANQSNLIQKDFLALHRAERERADRERRKAFLHASWENIILHTGQAKPLERDYIQITNSGAAAARNITVSVNRTPFDQVKGISHASTLQQITIGPNSYVRFQCSPSRNTLSLLPPMTIEIEWQDETNEPGKWIGSIVW